MSNTETLLAVLNQAADNVREVIEAISPHERRRRARGHPDQYEFDLAADNAVRSVILGAGYGMLSEESGWSGRDRDVAIIVDPVDGSANCSRGIGHYGPSLCAVDDDGPLASVVLNLLAVRRYQAVRGKGATVNGETLCSAGRRGLGLIATGDPCPYLERFPTPELRPVYTRMSGASAHDLCLVAEGAYDGYVDCVNTQSTWDYLGATLVLLEAGGVLEERNGRNLTNIHDAAHRQLIAAGSRDQMQDLTAWVRSTHAEGAPSH